MKHYYYLIAVLLLALTGSALIISTYGVFNHTFDEPAHIACGMEFWDRGTYTMEPMHPPLARIAVALGPFLSGIRPSNYADMWRAGNDILYSGNQYMRTLTMSRLAILTFFLLATLLVWFWSRTLFGDTAALFTTVLFISLPPILAHSGLATTDMPFTALFFWAIIAFTLWLEKPTYIRSVTLGISFALAILAKMSALVFLPASLAVLLVAFWIEKSSGALRENCRHWLKAGLLSIFVMFVAIWAGYRFSVETYSTSGQRPHHLIDQFVGDEGAAHDFAYAVAEKIPMPAVEFFRGIKAMAKMNASGQASYLLGEKLHKIGSWYFFPVVLAVKSPLPFMLFTIIGIGLLFFRRQTWSIFFLAPVYTAAAILLVSMWSNINIGVRHILPIYPFLAVIAGVGAAGLWNQKCSRWAGRGIVIVLLLWQAISLVRIHPDYIAYFNEFAERTPEKVVVDSDLDWGQDLQRLSDTLRRLNVQELSIAYFGSADLKQHGLPSTRRLEPFQPVSGWLAISLSALKERYGFEWLDKYVPVMKVGKSIRLYYIPIGEGIRSGTPGSTLPVK